MGRPIKQGLDYFPHDTDASSDEKLERLRAKYKNDGYAFYFITLERIYKTNNGELYLRTEEDKKVLAHKIHIGLKKFERILQNSFEIDLFNDQDFFQKGILTSDSIKRRFSQIQAERERKRKYYDKNKGVLDARNGGRKASETPGETTGETPQSKVKKSIIIELAKSLIESIQRESSIYSIINKYMPALGEDKFLDILLAFERKGNKFKNENLLAAYLEKCTQGNGRITDVIPFIEAGTPGYI